MSKVIMGLCALFALTAVAGGAQADRIRVTVNGTPVYFQGTQPAMVRGRVLVPLRGVLEQMGAYVEWEPVSQRVIASRGATQISLPIGSRYAMVNNDRVAMDVPAMTIGGRTMVPLRFVGEALGADVAWEPDASRVAITTGATPAAADIGRDESGRAHRTYRTGSLIVLPVGTVIPVRLDQALSSNGSMEGDPFSATVTGTDNGGLPYGTRFEGSVAEAIASSGNRPGVLDLDVRRVVFPDGTTRAVSGRVASLDSSAVTRGDGRLIARGHNAANDRLKWVGIGAGAGYLISSLTKGNRLIDSLLGAGAGYLYNELQNRGASNVRLNSGTEFGIRLDRPLRYAGGSQ